MKKIKRVALCLLFIFSCKAQKVDEVRKVTQPYTPPNCVWLRDNIFIDQTEVANIHYREYLFWLIRVCEDDSNMIERYNDSLEYRSEFLDSMVWLREIAYDESYTQYYFRHPAYNFYPVVGVSWEQATRYCAWRTDRVMEVIALQKKEHPQKKFPQKIIFRLPTNEEWKYAASGGLDSDSYPLGYETIIGKSGEPLVNTKELSEINVFNGKVTNDDKLEGDFTVRPVFSGKANKFGCFNMIGNVGEMVSEKGISKGGSFHHTLAESQISNDIPYDRPEAWLGFRCVCEVYW